MSIKPPVAAAVWSSIVFPRFSSVNLPRLGHWQLCSVEGWIVGATTSGIWDLGFLGWIIFTFHVSTLRLVLAVYSTFRLRSTMKWPKAQWYSYANRFGNHIPSRTHLSLLEKLDLLRSTVMCRMPRILIFRYSYFSSVSFAVSGWFFGGSVPILFNWFWMERKWRIVIIVRGEVTLGGLMVVVRTSNSHCVSNYEVLCNLSCWGSTDRNW